MRKALPIAGFFGILLVVSSLVLPHLLQVKAANLSQAMVRLDRVAANTSLSGLVCATPSAAGAGTEGRVSITFPSDFSLSSTTANWTTGTTDLPAGATAWPGISATAQSVSGNTVTFSSNDLTNGSANYCFIFSAASSATGSGGAKTGTLTTKTSGGATIDSREFGLTIGKDRIGVTAAVAAQPTDFTVSLTKTPGGSTFRQNHQITYDLAYSSLLSYAATDVTLEANWTLGTIEGSGIPTVEVLDYVTGTATTAMNNTPPVIDLLNRKITWSLGTIPAGASGSVRFILITSSVYTGSSPVSFTVSGRLLATGTATSYSSSTSQYLYNYSPPGPPGPTATPAPAAPTPTPVPRLRLEDIEIRSVSPTEAKIAVQFSAPTTVTTAYGLTPRSLTKRFTALDTTDHHLLTFSGLTTDTPYYFKLFWSDETGRQYASDIYTFTSAKDVAAPKIKPDSFIATSEKNIIFSSPDKQANGRGNIIILPPKTTFETQFTFSDNTLIKNSMLLVRNKRVLGINTFEKQVEAATNGAPLLEIKPGTYTGRLQTGAEPGFYDLVVRTDDYNGNIVEDTLAEVKISQPFRIYREDNHDPVERARVSLSIYNPRDQIYTYISPQTLSLRNPVYSEPDGTVPVVLPPGKYRAVIDGLGFEKKTVDFVIGVNPTEDYPTVALHKRPFSLLYGVQYLLLISGDLGTSLGSFIFDLGASRQILNFVGFLIVTSFLLLTLLALSHRTHVRLSHLPRYFLSLIRLAHSEPDVIHNYLGIIHDGRTKEALSDVDIFVSEAETGKVVFHTKSNSAGKFRISLPDRYVYLLELEKLGYHPASVHLHHLKKGEEQQFVLLETEEHLSLFESFIRLSHSLLNLSFEILLLLSIGGSLLLSSTIGFLPVSPFLALAIFNLVFWGLHEVHIRQ